MPMYDHVMEAASFIRARAPLQPEVALILGSGLGDLAAEISGATAIPYEEIPHFARSTVPGHAGRLLLGRLAEVPVVVMQGRFHFYEGYAPQMLTFPVRVMSVLGARTLLVTNAAGVSIRPIAPVTLCFCPIISIFKGWPGRILWWVRTTSVLEDAFHRWQRRMMPICASWPVRLPRLCLT